MEIAPRTRTRTRARMHTPLTHHPPTYPPTHQTCMNEILTLIILEVLGEEGPRGRAAERVEGRTQCRSGRALRRDGPGHNRRHAWSDCCMCAVRSVG